MCSALHMLVTGFSLGLLLVLSAPALGQEGGAEATPTPAPTPAIVLPPGGPGVPGAPLESGTPAGLPLPGVPAVPLDGITLPDLEQLQEVLGPLPFLRCSTTTIGFIPAIQCEDAMP